MSATFLLRSELVPRRPMLLRKPKPSSPRAYTPGTACRALAGSSYSVRSRSLLRMTCAEPAVRSMRVPTTLTSVMTSGGGLDGEGEGEGGADAGSSTFTFTGDVGVVVFAAGAGAGAGVSGAGAGVSGAGVSGAG